MGNAGERLERAVQQLNTFTTSEEFGRVLRFRVRFERIEKPAGVKMLILEEKGDENCMRHVVSGSSRRISLRDFNLFYNFITRSFKPELDAYLQTESSLPLEECPDKICAVCLERPTDLVLPCAVGTMQHSFCSACIMDWGDRDPTCPLCRHQVKSMLRDSYEVMGESSPAEALQSLRHSMAEAIGTLLCPVSPSSSPD
jgi:hypothetical protein